MPDYHNPEHQTSNTLITLWSDMHRQRQKLWLPVLSGSMLPFLHIGDRVLVESVKPGSIKIGDIIVFKSADKLVVHRVIYRYYNSGISFLQKGDNSGIAEIVRSENIIGRVTAVHRRNEVIYLNNSSWRVYNHSLTFLSWSAYFLRPKNLYLRRIAKFFYNKTKEILNQWS